MTVHAYPTRKSADHVLHADEFRKAMRQLVGAVSVITVGSGATRNGLTATSLSAFSADPPSVIVSVNRNASAYATLAEERRFGVNILNAQQQRVADHFAGRSGEKGAERYADARWYRLKTGVELLGDALAALDCEVDDLIERHSHAIVIGRVKAARVRETGTALLYWRGAYEQIGWSDEQIANAIGFIARCGV